MRGGAHCRRITPTGFVIETCPYFQLVRLLVFRRASSLSRVRSLPCVPACLCLLRVILTSLLRIRGLRIVSISARACLQNKGGVCTFVNGVLATLRRRRCGGVAAPSFFRFFFEWHRKVWRLEYGKDVVTYSSRRKEISMSHTMREGWNCQNGQLLFRNRGIFGSCVADR